MQEMDQGSIQFNQELSSAFTEGPNHKKSTHFVTNRVVWFQYTIADNVTNKSFQAQI